MLIFVGHCLWLHWQVRLENRLAHVAVFRMKIRSVLRIEVSGEYKIQLQILI